MHGASVTAKNWQRRMLAWRSYRRHDPIKAANLRLSFADERVIHYGIIPKSNRSIFVINELPDLQARIQVALFNILEEGDVQIRGFKLRLPLDILFVFTANPEDYTNRGSIVTR
jgi:magnesium chelatase subunit I